MHPAYSVIFFTSTSGAGYGLLIWLGLLGAGRWLPPDPGLGLLGFPLAFLMIAAGLIASTYHLGQPRRAWRAFSQWRSSWLSREAVLALASFLPALPYAAFWILGEQILGALGLLLALLAGGTIAATAMIYASLKPIPRWHNPWVLPAYLALGSAGGLLLVLVLARLAAIDPGIAIPLALLNLAIGGAIKLIYWRSIDRAAPRLTAAAAIGLPKAGPVRSLTRPHTEENYLLREMGYRIARRHARKLRLYALILGFFLPAILTGAGSILTSWLGILALAAAFLSHAVGILAERWLFFAEAKHSVILYYGAEAV